MRFSAITIIALVVLFAAMAGVSIYIHRFIRRTAQALRLRADTKPRKIIIIALTVVLILCSLNLFSMSAIVLLHFWLFSMLTDLADLLVRRLRQNRSHAIWTKLHKSCLIPLSVTAIVLGLGYLNMHNITKTEYTVSTDKAIRAEGYRVAMVADLHFGVSIDLEELRAVCDEISAQNVDLLVLVGDITDEGTTKSEMEAVYAAFGSVETTLGTYFSYGNHDRQLYSQNRAFSTDELTAAIEANGITILQDSAVSVTDDLTIIGREDLSMARQTPRKLLEELLVGVDADDYLLVLDHQPSGYAENAAQKTDLLLSGHTHAGQIWPANLFLSIAKINDAVYGVTEIDSFTGIVTSGIAGWKYPIKTSAPAEYVIIDIAA